MLNSSYDINKSTCLIKLECNALNDIYCNEKLCKSENGELFVVRAADCEMSCLDVDGEILPDGRTILPLSDEKARFWVRTNFAKKAYEKIFGSPADYDEQLYTFDYFAGTWGTVTYDGEEYALADDPATGLSIHGKNVCDDGDFYKHDCYVYAVAIKRSDATEEDRMRPLYVIGWQMNHGIETDNLEDAYDRNHPCVVRTFGKIDMGTCNIPV